MTKYTMNPVAELDDAAWALPYTSAAREQFQWLAVEIQERGGEALDRLCRTATGIAGHGRKERRDLPLQRGTGVLSHRGSRAAAGLPVPEDAEYPGAEGRRILVGVSFSIPFLFLKVQVL